MKIEISREELRMFMVELEDDKNAIRDTLKVVQDQCRRLENDLADARSRYQDNYSLVQENHQLKIKIDDLKANLANPQPKPSVH